MEIRVETLDKIKPVLLHFTHEGDMFIGEANPIPDSCHDGICEELAVELNGVMLGTIRSTQQGWRMEANLDQQIVDAVGNAIALWYK